MRPAEIVEGAVQRSLHGSDQSITAAIQEDLYAWGWRVVKLGWASEITEAQLYAVLEEWDGEGVSEQPLGKTAGVLSDQSLNSLARHMWKMGYSGGVDDTRHAVATALLWRNRARELEKLAEVRMNRICELEDGDRDDG